MSDSSRKKLQKSPVNTGTTTNFGLGHILRYAVDKIRDGAKVDVKHIGKLSDRSRNMFGEVESSPLNGKDFFHHTVSTPNDTYHFLSTSHNLEPGTIVTGLHVEHYPHMDAPAVNLSANDWGAGGFGYGRELYKLAIKHHGHLKSDGNISESADKMWNKLVSDPELQGSLGESGKYSSRHYAAVKSEEDLEKASKNVREQRKKVFGSTAAPSTKSPMREKHINHIKKFVKDFLGLDLHPSGGKISEKTGKRRDENPEEGMDKPDWRSGRLESQWNPEAIVHEIAHLLLMPEGVGLEDGQRLMDRQYADVQKQYGYLQQKRSQHEVQPMAAEQIIRRILGLPASKVATPVSSPDQPPRTSVEDPSKVIATRIKSGKTKSGEDKYIDLIRQSRFLTEENKKRLEDVFTRKIKFDPVHGWVPSGRLDAAISTRSPGFYADQVMPKEEAPARMKPKLGGVSSASKYTPWKTLEQIKRDNYVGAGGKEYDPSDLENEMQQRKNAAANRLVAEADRRMRSTPVDAPEMDPQMEGHFAAARAFGENKKYQVHESASHPNEMEDDRFDEFGNPKVKITKGTKESDFPILAKSKKDILNMFGKDIQPHQSEFANWAAKTMPNSNWQVWATRHYRNKPEDFTPEVKQKIEHFSGSLHLPEIDKVRFEKQHDLHTGLNILDDAEKAANKRLLSSVNMVKPTEKTKMVVPGSTKSNRHWFGLGKGACSAEGKAMGHCGNVPSKQEGDKVLSLRTQHFINNREYHEPHLTFISNRGFLGEMKGRGNQKPAKEYHDDIVELLKDPRVKGIMGGGYAPENNFEFKDLSPERQQEVLRVNPNFIPDDSDENIDKWLDRFAESPWHENATKFYQELAERENLTLEQQRRMVGADNKRGDDFGPEIREALAGNPILHPSLYRHFLDGSEFERDIASRNPNLPAEFLEELAQDTDNEHMNVVANVAHRPELSLATIKRLADHKDPAVRTAVASNPNLPVDLQEKIFNDADKIMNKSRPYERDGYTSRYTADYVEALRILERLAQNPNLKPDFQDELLRHKEEAIKKSIAVNPSLSVEKQRAIIDGVYTGDNSLLSSLAENTNLHPDLIDDMIRELYADGSSSGLINLCQNSSVKGDHLVELFNLTRSGKRKRDGHYQWQDSIDHSLATRRDLPPELYSALEKEDDDITRHYLARNPGYQQYKQINKSEFLYKGSFQSRNKPQPDDRHKWSMRAMKVWANTGSQGQRLDVKPLQGNSRNRMLHKLSGMTKVKVDPQGKRLFLLHRGMSNKEMEKNLTPTHTNYHRPYSLLSVNSWSPDHAQAFWFGFNPNNNSNVTSAWIHEDDIHDMPMLLRDVSDRIKNEKEVIVKHTRPHELVDSNQAFKMAIPFSSYDQSAGETKLPVKANDGYYDDKDVSTIDTRINTRANKSELQKAPPLDEPQRRAAEMWAESADSEDREFLHRSMMLPEHRQDRIHIIKGLSEDAKIKKIDGNWHVKLYRVHSPQESINSYKRVPRSFHYDLKAAEDHIKTKPHLMLTEHWIPVQHISYSYDHAHRINGPKHPYSYEKEVIAGPLHNYKKVMKIEFNLDTEEELIKFEPTQPGQIHPTQPWISKVHPNGKVMWHANPEQVQTIDRTINDPRNVDYLVSSVPETHRPLLKQIIKMTQKDPNRHFIPTMENGKQKLRARHLRGLMLSSPDIALDTKDPSVLKIHRTSHSTLRGRNTPEITMQFAAKVAKNENGRSLSIQVFGNGFDKIEWMRSADPESTEND